MSSAVGGGHRTVFSITLWRPQTLVGLSTHVEGAVLLGRRRGCVEVDRAANDDGENSAQYTKDQEQGTVAVALIPRQATTDGHHRHREHQIDDQIQCCHESQSGCVAGLHVLPWEYSRHQDPGRGTHQGVEDKRHEDEAEHGDAYCCGTLLNNARKRADEHEKACDGTQGEARDFAHARRE